MATATLMPEPKNKTKSFGIESNGTLMTPAEFDTADFDDQWRYELINEVLIVSPLPLLNEADPNEELGFLLRLYQHSHAKGKSLNLTVQERHVRTGKNRRRADRVIWAGLGRLPRKNEKPTVVIEFVSKRKRDRERDYVAKRAEYQSIKVQECWIIDRFTKTMTVHILDGNNFREKVINSKQSYRTKLLPGFELPLADLFELANRWSDEIANGMGEDA
jgi:Uma2 family endonuclease